MTRSLWAPSPPQLVSDVLEEHLSRNLGAQALLAMVDNTVRAREMPELMLEVLTGVAESASAIESERGESGEVIRDLLDGRLRGTFGLG